MRKATVTPCQHSCWNWPGFPLYCALLKLFHTRFAHAVCNSGFGCLIDFLCLFRIIQSHFSDELSDLLAPVQMGVGNRGATEQVGRKLQRLLKTNCSRPRSGWHVLQLTCLKRLALPSVCRGWPGFLPELLFLSFNSGSSLHMVNRCFVTRKCFLPAKAPNQGTCWGRGSSPWLSITL